MKTIYKYVLEERFRPQSLSMPAGAQILSLQLQNNKPTLWALVDETAGHVPRTFVIVPTGVGSIDPERMTYVGTYQQDIYVWHVFEVVG